jgi:hypothetical protein
MHDSTPGPTQARSFFLLLRKAPFELKETELREALRAEAGARALASPDHCMALGFVERSTGSSSDSKRGTGNTIQLLLGDASEFPESDARTPMANAALLRVDLAAKAVQAVSSITGLPPLFIYEDSSQTIVTSDPFCLVPLVSSGLRFDAEGVLDLCGYGFTVGHRTLFRGLRLVPGGSSLAIDASEAIAIQKAWTFTAQDRLSDWNAYTQLQKEAFLAGIRKMDLKDSFLSLTAGVDTRTILAVLAGMGRSIPACTLSGETPSLDALTARELCKAYKIEHEIIPLDADFRKNLPEYTLEASRLSGGLASLGQAHQVYLYRKLPRAYFGRVSGNMGNQLGRQGVERVSMRGADASILAPELRKNLPQRPKFAWSNENTGGVGLRSHEFLFQREFLFTQLGNTLVGGFFAVQQSPYANRDLIGLCQRQPARSDGQETTSRLRLRLKDLHHRFLGEPETFSFQRRLIHEAGGFAAAYPINWGWKAKGGVSLPGMIRGGMTAADAYTESAGWDAGLTGGVLRGLGITGLHEHRKPKRWLKDSLRDFVHDSLQSTEAKNSGLLDSAATARMLEEHYQDRTSHHGALLLALDVALAAKNFRAATG